MEKRPALRASDSDRERVAECLRHATAEGRLFADELEERLEAVFSARTYGELDRLVADLPATPARPGPRSTKPTLARAAVPVAILLALLAALATTARVPALQFRQSAQAARGARVFGFDHHASMFLAAAPITGILAILALVAALGWMLHQHNPWTDGRGGGPAAR
jgi:Domain of unknown function (DUF1707)